MNLTGSNTPNRVTTLEPLPNFTVVSGELVEETAPAVELTRRLVLAWIDGYRDLRNPALSVFQEETLRSRVSTDDAVERYTVITELAEELSISPVDQSEFIRLFLPSAAPAVFLDTLQRMGVELEFQQDLQTVTGDVLKYENPVQPVLTGLQETDTRLINPDAVAALLEEISRPALAESTDHFADDYEDNNAIDGDDKAHDRIFVTFAEYVKRLLLVQP